MAYLTILAIGSFGLLIAGVSHYFVSRERREILAAQATESEVASDDVARNELVTIVAKPIPAQTAKLGGGRMALTGAKQYSKRVVVK